MRTMLLSFKVNTEILKPKWNSLDWIANTVYTVTNSRLHESLLPSKISDRVLWFGSCNSFTEKCKNLGNIIASCVSKISPSNHYFISEITYVVITHYSTNFLSHCQFFHSLQLTTFFGLCKFRVLKYWILSQFISPDFWVMFRANIH